MAGVAEHLFPCLRRVQVRSMRDASRHCACKRGAAKTEFCFFPLGTRCLSSCNVLPLMFYRRPGQHFIFSMPALLIHSVFPVITPITMNSFCSLAHVTSAHVEFHCNPALKAPPNFHREATLCHLPHKVTFFKSQSGPNICMGVRNMMDVFPL